MAKTSTTFQKGRAKAGGRKKGTLNKRTEALMEKMKALGCDPVEGMARLAMDENNSPELRGRMFAELAQYVAPKQRAVEHSGELDVRHENWLARGSVHTACGERSARKLRTMDRCPTGAE